MAFTLGKNAKLYRNTATWATPTFDEITNVRDLKQNLTAEEIDVTIRGGGGWDLKAPGNKNGAVEFEMLWDDTDADFTALKDAFFNETSIELLALDGSSATSGKQGLRADMSVLSFERNEPLRGPITVSVKVAPTNSTNTPVWYVVP